MRKHNPVTLNVTIPAPNEGHPSITDTASLKLVQNPPIEPDEASRARRNVIQLPDEKMVQMVKEAMRR